MSILKRRFAESSKKTLANPNYFSKAEKKPDSLEKITD